MSLMSTPTVLSMSVIYMVSDIHDASDVYPISDVHDATDVFGANVYDVCDVCDNHYVMIFVLSVT